MSKQNKETEKKVPENDNTGEQEQEQNINTENVPEGYDTEQPLKESRIEMWNFDENPEIECIFKGFDKIDFKDGDGEKDCPLVENIKEEFKEYHFSSSQQLVSKLRNVQPGSTLFVRFEGKRRIKGGKTVRDFSIFPQKKKK